MNGKTYSIAAFILQVGGLFDAYEKTMVII